MVINEVEFNPPGDDYDNEWVELYNTGDEEADISGWKLLTTKGRVACIRIPTIPRTLIPPRGFVVVVGSGQWLDNENEIVVLQDEFGVEIDRTPCLGDDTDSYCAWSRYPDGEDTDTNFEWGFMNSTPGEPASGNICYPEGERVYFHLSGSVKGDISAIEVTPRGRLATPPQSYYANVNDQENKFQGRTTALEGYCSSDELMSNSVRAVLHPAPGVIKPDTCEYYYGVYGSKTIEYTGKGLNDREYLGRERSYYSGAEFLYNKEFSKERLSTSLKVHTTGIADLEFREIDSGGNLSREFVDRYTEIFDIERHIISRHVNDSYRVYDGYVSPCHPPRALYYDKGMIVEVYNNESLEIYDDWLTCCLDTTLVGSKESDVYHYCWCEYAQRIKPENQIWFSSPNEAESQGYRPCEICKPSSEYCLWTGPYAECGNSTS